MPKIIEESHLSNILKNGKRTRWQSINNLGQTLLGTTCAAIMIALTSPLGNPKSISIEPMDKVPIVWSKAKASIPGNILLRMVIINSWPLMLGKEKIRRIQLLTNSCRLYPCSPKRGPSRPFNFFGYLTSSTMDRLATALQKPSNHTFVVRPNQMSSKRKNELTFLLSKPSETFLGDKVLSLPDDNNDVWCFEGRPYLQGFSETL